MFLLLFFLALFSNGYIVKTYTFSRQSIIFNFISSFALGAFFSVGLVYFLDAYIFKSIDKSIFIFLFLSLILCVLEKKKYVLIQKIDPLRVFSRHLLMIIVLFVALSFSWYIFSKAFTYDIQQGQFSIASNVYADMGIHIPFIRSFSLGRNVPAEVPVFGNKNLPYHFMTDYFVGILEYLGLRIDHALNVVSSLAFTALIFAIYFFSTKIFNNRIIGLLSVFLFFCTNNFALFDFLAKNSSFPDIISSFWHNTTYYSNGPLGKETIAVYWTLNTYINQRQLIFGILFVLIILIFLVTRSKHETYSSGIIPIGLVGGGISFWNSLLFLALLGIFVGFIFFFSEYRRKAIMLLAISIIFAAPFLFIVSQGAVHGITFNPGFLIHDSFSFVRFFLFWQWNLGLILWILLLGFIFMDKKNKKLFTVFLVPFIIANIFQFGNDMVNSHKLVNLALIFISMTASYGIFWLYSHGFFQKSLSLFIIIFLFLSGVLNLLVIKNDVRTLMYDYPSNSLMQWALINLPSEETILTNGEIYDPMSLIGKKIFLGRLYYITSYGGDVTKRAGEEKILFEGKDAKEIETILKKNDIHYVVFYKEGFAKNNRTVNLQFYLSTYKKIYEDMFGTVFEV